MLIHWPVIFPGPRIVDAKENTIICDRQRTEYIFSNLQGTLTEQPNAPMIQTISSFSLGRKALTNLSRSPITSRIFLSISSRVPILKAATSSSLGEPWSSLNDFAKPISFSSIDLNTPSTYAEEALCPEGSSNLHSRPEPFKSISIYTHIQPGALLKIMTAYPQQRLR